MEADGRVMIFLASKENLPASIFKRLPRDQVHEENKYPRFQKFVNAILPWHAPRIKGTIHYNMGRAIYLFVCSHKESTESFIY